MEVLALRLNLPRTFIQQAAEARTIPYLDVNGRKRFSEASVRDALERLAIEATARGNDSE